MDESESLESLVNGLNNLAERPYDVTVHSEFVKLTQSLEGLESEIQSGLEMITQYMASTDEVWLPLLMAKRAEVDLSASEGVEELLNLYSRAEADYLSIPILESHLEFILEQYERYASEEQIKPDTLDELFSVEWTRSAVEEVVKKGLIHLTEGHKLFTLQWEWELAALETAPKKERASRVEEAQKLLLNRLRQPQADMESTFQAYSSFTTNFLPPQDYENLMVSASKLRAQSVKAFERREQHETALRTSGDSLEAYNSYIGYERRARYLDLFCIRGVYERAISEAAKRRFSGTPGAEEALRLFWAGYCDALRIVNAGLDFELETVRRAVRSVPGSGELWARYLRLLERIATSETELFEGIETVPEVYNRAINTKLVPNDIEQLILTVLARAGYERRQFEAGIDNDETLPVLIGVLESGVEMARQASKTGDLKLRLEKFLAQIYQNTGLIDNVIEVWKAASKHSKSSYSIWLNYTDALINNQRYDEARQVFTEVHTKHLDWPEAIWEAWTSFEHIHGSFEDLESCLDKIEKAQYQTNVRRAKEAEKAMYQELQNTSAQVQASALIAEAAASVDEGTAMNVDHTSADRGTKRTMEGDDTESSNPHKKAKFESKPPPPPLKRDREHTTVFVADLPSGVSEDELKSLFKDCGTVREVKISHLETGPVATVEFVDRDSVPAALTKDKKRIQDQEVAVHLAWKSTLYVTNFPESADDEYMKDMFSKYGTIFETRWPSKKFKSTRRFCYIQFTLPASAQAAIELHGRELEPNVPLCVYLSNPERKKERTDQDANEREVYVAGLSKFTKKADLEKLFSTYGSVKEVRIALEADGSARGFAFVEFEDTQDAQKALMANNHELKNRRIAVTLADPRVRARHKTELGLSRAAEARNRSLYVKNLPPATQEGLLQQAFEKIAPVNRVEVFLDLQEAVVELQNPADVGKLLLRTEAITFDGNTLELSEYVPSKRTGKVDTSSKSTPVLFKPRHLGSKPKTGLGFKKGNPSIHRDTSSTSAPTEGGKGQDDFRKMLLK